MTSADFDRNGLVIRPAREADCEALTALMLRSGAYTGRYRRMIENYPVTPEMVCRHEVWTVERNGKLIAFYRLDFASADLDLMFVADEAQGTGVGSLIFQHMKDRAATAGLREVQIVAHPPAADFYRRMGARDAGVSKAKTADGWDRPILKLAIGR